MLKTRDFIRKPLVSVISATVAAGMFTVAPSALAVETLEEVVVYGRKKAESLQDAPLVVNVFGSESIDRFNINNMEDVSEFTPGLIIGDAVSNSGPVITLRGVQTPPANQAADQAISFVVDGVAVSSSSIARASQIDVQQVEVLKGPQALFFGKNSTGGILNYVTNDPTDEFEVILKGGYEFEADESFGQLIVSGPITDTLKGRAVFRYSDMEGWLDTSAPEIPAFGGFAPGGPDSRGPNNDSRFFRGTLVWEPTDDLSMRTKYSYDHLNHQGVVGTSQFGGCTGGSNGPAGLVPAGTDDCDADDNAPQQGLSQAALDALGGGNDPSNHGDSQQTLFSHEIKYAFSDTLELTSVTGFFENKSYYINQFQPGLVGFHSGENPSEQEHWSQEFRLSSSFDGPVNFTVGGFYGDSEFESQTVVFFPITDPSLLPAFSPGLVTAAAPIRHIDTQAWSVFGQLNWDVSDTVSITAGARYSEEDKEFTAIDDGLELVFTDKDNRERSFDDLSPEVTITWQAADNINLFASYKEGFKSGGYNVTLIPLIDSQIGAFLDMTNGFPIGTTPESEASYDQENVEGYEIGIKSQWLDDRLRLNAAAYYYEFTNLQAAIFNASTSSLNIVNSSEQTTYGVDIDLTYLSESIDGLMFTSSLAWNESEYSDAFPFGCYSGQTIAEGCTGGPDAFNNTTNAGGADGIVDRDALGNQMGTQDLDGAQTPNAPELQATFGVVYEFPVADDYSLELNALATYSDQFFTEQEHSPNSIQDSHWKYHAGATLRPSDDKWSLSVTGRNLSNEYVCTLSGKIAASLARPADDLFCSIQRGRQVWVEAEYRF